MDWTVLGIAPTKDEKVITDAYRTRLTNVNPEDHPEEFKALRAAYEEALRLARLEEIETEKDDSPIGLWMEKVKAIYEDFSARIQLARWQELLGDDLCLALDTRPQVEAALLEFFMESYHLPQVIWQLLDHTFSWMDRKEELYENYPRDFIDYVIVDGVNYQEALPCELFEPGQSGADCDNYRSLYFRGNRTANEELQPILDQMDELSEWHPYGELLRCRCLFGAEKSEEARKLSKELAQRYPHEMRIVLFWIEACADEGKWDEVEKLCRKVLEESPGLARAKRLLAESLAQREEYLEAKELMYQLVDDSNGDLEQIGGLTETMRQWNELLLAKLEKQYQENPEDEENAYELGWCYLQSNLDEKAKELCKHLSKTPSDPYGYHNLCAKVALSTNDYQNALEHLCTGEKILRKLQPDGTTKIERRIRKLPEYLQLQGVCHQELGDEEMAEKCFEEALAVDPENTHILTDLIRIYQSKKMYIRAVELATKLTQVLPDAYHSHLLLASGLFELHEDRDAFAEINRSIELNGNELFSYILKLKILLRNSAWDAVHDELKFLHEHGVNGEIHIDWCEAQLIEFEQKDEAKALEAYKGIAKRIEEGEEMGEAPDVYHRITVLEARGKDCREKDTNQKLMAILDKGLSYGGEHFDCLDYKAWLYKVAGNDKEALEIFHKLEKMPRRGLYIEQELAEIYYHDLVHNGDKALHYYQMLVEKEERGEYYFYIGTCYRYLGDYEASIQAFLKEQELDPDDIDGYKGLSYAYEYAGDYEKALEQTQITVDMAIQAKKNINANLYHKIKLLRRLGRPEEALKTAEELDKYSENHEPDYKIQFEICIQFGLWDRAQLILARWKGSGLEKQDYLEASIRFDVLRGQLARAKGRLLFSGNKMKKSAKDSLLEDLAGVELDAKAQLKYWDEVMAEHPNDSRGYLNYAEVLAQMGNKKDAHMYARKALNLIEKEILNDVRDNTLFHARRAIALAVLGRMDEAQEEMDRIHGMRLCEMCSYGGCKDAEFYEAEFYELSGDYAEAMKCYKKGHERWPEELDFVAGINRMVKKGF